IIYTDAMKTVEVGRIDFSEIERIIFCFTPGTMICTDRGDVAVESLRAGDLVVTRDSGLQPLRWTGSRTLSQRELQAKPDLQPVRIAMGAFAGAGPERTMLVSPQHRILIEGARAEILFGEAEVLVPAKHLIGHIEATRALPVEGVTYVHLLFDRHEVVLSDGIWTESFQPAERSLNAMEDAVRDEILALFPELQVDSDGFQSARMSLKAHEVKVLLSN
ncbi:MAG: Hint domain-containing protein, partial [Tabrizicola sp.]|nr:Hint domain-containing protein [Tabrizicola sp.]